MLGIIFRPQDAVSCTLLGAEYDMRIAGGAAAVAMSRGYGLLHVPDPLRFVGDWSLTAIPTFLPMGCIASASGLTSGPLKAMRMFLSRLPGGLAVAGVGACGPMSADSGSSVAVSAAFARIAMPEMLK